MRSGPLPHCPSGQPEVRADPQPTPGHARAAEGLQAERGWCPAEEGWVGVHRPPGSAALLHSARQRHPWAQLVVGGTAGVAGMCVRVGVHDRARRRGLRPSLPGPRPTPPPTPPLEGGGPAPPRSPALRPHEPHGAARVLEAAVDKDGKTGGPHPPLGAAGVLGRDTGWPGSPFPAQAAPGALGLRGPVEESQATVTPLGCGGDRDGTSGLGPRGWDSRAAPWSLAAGPRAVPGTGERGGARETPPP